MKKCVYRNRLKNREFGKEASQNFQAKATEIKSVNSLLICLGIYLIFFVSHLLANPKGAEVISGNAHVNNHGQLTEIHAADRTIIHWDEFSIQNGETTRFIQPNSSAAVLNRVTGPHPSLIHGILEGNGRVILVNSHGVIVGPEGVIRVADFIGSTYDVLDLSDWSLHLDRSHAVHLQGEASVINQEGVIEATGFQLTGGKVLLVADELHMTGDIKASQGTVEMLADRIILEKEATIDVSGNVGGVVCIGDNTPKSVTLVGSGVHLCADAKEQGNGGSILLWSGESTQFHGTATARGGMVNGNGGLIEISSEGTLGCTGKLDASAPFGKSGQVLFDPCDITIGPVAAGPPFTFPVYTPGANATITGLSIQAALAGGSDVTINTSPGAGGTGVVLWTSTETIIWFTANNLTINADSDVNINAGIAASGGGTITVNSSGGSLNLQGAAPALSSGGFGTVMVNVALDVNMIGTALGQDLEIAAKTINITAGRDVLMNHPTAGALGNNTIFSFAPLGGGTAPITINAGRDIIIGQFSEVISNNGPILMIANRNIQMLANSSVNLIDFFSGAINPIVLVADNQAPTSPQVGNGAFLMDAGAVIGNPSRIAPVQIFTARRSQNVVNGTINGTLFVPGPVNVDTDTERWLVYYPNAFLNLFSPQFTIFYKALQEEEAMFQQMQAVIAQSFILFEEFAWPPIGYEDFFCITECLNARDWSGQEKSDCPWVQINNYRKFYPSRTKYGFVIIDHASILPPECDQ